MKRTLTLISAAVFASALALPAFAQIGADVSGDASVSEHRESTREYRNETAPAPAMSDTMKKESESHSYRSDSMGGPEMSRHVESRESRRSTTEAMPPPTMQHSETRTTRTERRTDDNDHRGLGANAGVGANVGPLGAHVGAGADAGGNDTGGY